MTSESQAGMFPKIASLVSHADARRADVEGARVARLAKKIMMPITTPMPAGRTRAS